MGNANATQSIKLPNTIYLVRHGERADEAGEEHDGHTHDPPLTALGEKQADATGLRFKEIKIDHVFASPFARTLQTARGICRQLNQKIKVDASLSEEFLMNLDDDVIQPFKNLVELYPEIDPAYKTQFDKEGMIKNGLTNTISLALARMIQNSSASESIILVTHRVLYRFILDYLIIEDCDTINEQVPYCSVTKLNLASEKIQNNDANNKGSNNNDKTSNKKVPVNCRKYVIEYSCDISHLQSVDEKT